MNQQYKNHLGRKHQVVRFMWSVVWTVGARWMPRSVGTSWKRILLQLFGAKMAPTAAVYSSTKVYYPPYLTMDEYACLAPDVDCYNVAPIRIGKYVTVSQGTMLCTASHDISSSKHELITAPIIIEDQAWVGAQAFVGMGVTVGKGAVVGARAAVFRNVEPWTIVGGNPAKFIKTRIINK